MTVEEVTTIEHLQDLEKQASAYLDKELALYPTLRSDKILSEAMGKWIEAKMALKDAEYDAIQTKLLNEWKLHLRIAASASILDEMGLDITSTTDERIRRVKHLAGLYPRERNPMQYFSHNGDHMEVCVAGKKKIIYYDVSPRIWHEMTGWE